MNATNAVSIDPARLPYLDRRALSEAWYAALHLAAAPHGAGAAPRRAAVPARAVADRPAARAAARNALRGQTPLAARSPRAAESGASGGSAGLRVRTSPRPLATRAVPAARASAHAHVTLTFEGARVRLIARRDGPRTQVIALCSAEHVAVVRRALGVLACALRLRGERLEAVVRTVAFAERENA